MAELVKRESPRDGLSVLTLNRAERRNALSIELMTQLCAALDGLAADAAERVVILRGAGPVFCAGLDLKEATDADLTEKSARLVERTLHTLSETPLVVIAAVHGGAFAGGGGVMAACDIVVVAEDARISFPEARRGLLPALITGVLQHKVRGGDLRELFLAGEAIDATRAQQMGLVQRVVPAARLADEARAVAEAVLAGGPETIRQTKRMLNELAATPGPERAARQRAWHESARRSAEAREGLAAFLDKRTPDWQAPSH